MHFIRYHMNWTIPKMKIGWQTCTACGMLQHSCSFILTHPWQPYCFWEPKKVYLMGSSPAAAFPRPQNQNPSLLPHKTQPSLSDSEEWRRRDVLALAGTKGQYVYCIFKRHYTDIVPDMSTVFGFQIALKQQHSSCATTLDHAHSVIGTPLPISL